MTDESMVLGESPLWDHRSGTLRWVDIAGRKIHSLAPDGKRLVRSAGNVVGSIALSGETSLIAGLGRRIVEMDLAGGQRKLAKPARRGTRMNDGGVDPAGRLWMGTCPVRGDRPRGSLFRFVLAEAPTEVLSDVGISNGIGWSPDSSRMYYIDTPTGRVDVMAFEEESGAIHDRRPFTRISDDVGVPDGLCVDSAGNVWVAVWGGGRLLVYSEESTLVEQVLVPIPNVTSACFGGPGLSSVFITTARADPSSPASGGAVYVAQSPTVGMPSNVFSTTSGGDLE